MRGLIVFTILLFVAMAVALIVGFSTSAAGLMVLALFVFGPGFTFSLGVVVGRASNEFALIRRADNNSVARNGNTRSRSRHSAEYEPMS